MVIYDPPDPPPATAAPLAAPPDAPPAAPPAAAPLLQAAAAQWSLPPKEVMRLISRLRSAFTVAERKLARAEGAAADGPLATAPRSSISAARALMGGGEVERRTALEPLQSVDPVVARGASVAISQAEIYALGIGGTTRPLTCRAELCATGTLRLVPSAKYDALAALDGSSSSPSSSHPSSRPASSSYCDCGSRPATAASHRSDHAATQNDGGGGGGGGGGAAAAAGR